MLTPREHARQVTIENMLTRRSIAPLSLHSTSRSAIMGFFDKIKQGLKKTKQLLNTDVRDLFKSKGGWSTTPFSKS